MLTRAGEYPDPILSTAWGVPPTLVHLSLLRSSIETQLHAQTWPLTSPQTAGHLGIFYILGKDQFGNNMTFSSIPWDVSVCSTDQQIIVPVTVSLMAGSMYNGSFNATVATTYVVSVAYQGNHLTGSPMLVSVVPGAVLCKPPPRYLPPPPFTEVFPCASKSSFKASDHMLSTRFFILPLDLIISTLLVRSMCT